LVSQDEPVSQLQLLLCSLRTSRCHRHNETNFIVLSREMLASQFICCHCGLCLRWWKDQCKLFSLLSSTQFNSFKRQESALYRSLLQMSIKEFMSSNINYNLRTSLRQETWNRPDQSLEFWYMDISYYTRAVTSAMHRAYLSASAVVLSYTNHRITLTGHSTSNSIVSVMPL